MQAQREREPKAVRPPAATAHVPDWEGWLRARLDEERRFVLQCVGTALGEALRKERAAAKRELSDEVRRLRVEIKPPTRRSASFAAPSRPASAAARSSTSRRWRGATDRCRLTISNASPISSAISSATATSRRRCTSVLIGSNGSVSVRHHTDGKAETVCSKVVASGFTGPIVVAVIGQDGCGKSARITIEAVGPILQ